MQKKRIAAFDIDEVLYPLRNTLVEAFTKRFGYEVNTETYDCYSFAGFLARDYGHLHKVMQNNGGKFGHFRYISDMNLLVTIPPYQGAAETIRKVMDAGFSIALITFRGTLEKPDMFYNNGVKETLAWLERYQIPFDTIKFTSEKAKALSEIQKEINGKVIVYAEDHPANVVPLVKAGYKVALVDKPYNRRELIGSPDATDYGKGSHTDRDWKKALDSGLVHRIKSITEIESILS